MSDAAQTGSLQGQIGRRNIDPHATNHNRHKLVLAKPQAEIIHALHLCPYGIQPVRDSPQSRPRAEFYAIVKKLA
jgi:hypothetical protein